MKILYVDILVRLGVSLVCERRRGDIFFSLHWLHGYIYILLNKLLWWLTYFKVQKYKVNLFYFADFFPNFLHNVALKTRISVFLHIPQNYKMKILRILRILKMEAEEINWFHKRFMFLKSLLPWFRTKSTQ